MGSKKRTGKAVSSAYRADEEIEQDSDQNQTLVWEILYYLILSVFVVFMNYVTLRREVGPSAQSSNTAKFIRS